MYIMLYTEEYMYDNVINPFDILNESIYLTIDESTITNDMIPIIQNNRLNTYLTESTYNYIPSNTTVILDESDVIEDPTIINEYNDYVIRPINEQHEEYQYVLECLDNWVDMNYDDDMLISLLEINEITDEKIKKAFFKKFPHASNAEFTRILNQSKGYIPYRYGAYKSYNSKYDNYEDIMTSYVAYLKNLQDRSKMSREERRNSGGLDKRWNKHKDYKADFRDREEGFANDPDDLYIKNTDSDSEHQNAILRKNDNSYYNIHKITKNLNTGQIQSEQHRDSLVDRIIGIVSDGKDPYSTSGFSKIEYNSNKTKTVKDLNNNRYKIPYTLRTNTFLELPKDQRELVSKNFTIIRKSPILMKKYGTSLNSLLQFDPKAVIKSVKNPDNPNEILYQHADGTYTKSTSSAPPQEQPKGETKQQDTPPLQPATAATPKPVTKETPSKQGNVKDKKKGNFLSNHKGKIGLGLGLAAGGYLAYKNRDKLKSLTSKGWENYQQYKNRPKSVIAKRIASLRGVYKKFMLEAQRNPQKANVFKRMAAKILSVIDKLLHYMQNKADGKNTAYNPNY